MSKKDSTLLAEAYTSIVEASIEGREPLTPEWTKEEAPFDPEKEAQRDKHFENALFDVAESLVANMLNFREPHEVEDLPHLLTHKLPKYVKEAANQGGLEEFLNGFDGHDFKHARYLRQEKYLPHLEDIFEYVVHNIFDYYECPF